jgi:sulfate adenylyltransferase
VTVALRRGVCVWFTGLSGSGKSTTANILIELLRQLGREVTVLDGDVVRTHLSAGLGFSREDRDTNVRRIGYVAGEVVRHGGLVVAAVVSPYRRTRDEVREMVGHDNFLEVFVDTPIEVCEARDVKGWYAKARSGEITGLTGVDDPYEPPLSPEMTLHTTDTTPDANARLVLDELRHRGFVDPA